MFRCLPFTLNFAKVLKLCYGTYEALPAPQRFAGLSAKERQAVIRFLESLTLYG